MTPAPQPKQAVEAKPRSRGFLPSILGAFRKG